MADVTVSTTIDNFMQAADADAAKTVLSIGTTLSSNGAAPFVMVHDSGGDARGNNSIDLQIQRTDPLKIAGGVRSSLVGGLNNTATGIESTVIGGTNNTASGDRSAIIGGSNNIAQGSSSEVLGGDGSYATGQGSSTIGGNLLSSFGNWSAAVGGQSNHIQTGHLRSVILGGVGIVSDASTTVYVPTLDVQDTIYLKLSSTSGNNKPGKCQLWVDDVGDLYLTLPDGTDKQIAFV